MRKKIQAKGLTLTEYLAAIKPALDMAVTALGLAAQLHIPAMADTVYRCGDAYSTSNQCANTTASEVKPTSILHVTKPDKHSTASSELREAQALEKQRLKIERQTVQTTSVQRNTPDPPAPAPLESVPHHGKNKHARSKSPNPYFSAVDPNTTHQKKSTAKAVPVNP